jgi:hypothetical protein
MGTCVYVCTCDKLLCKNNFMKSLSFNETGGHMGNHRTVFIMHAYTNSFHMNACMHAQSCKTLINIFSMIGLLPVIPKWNA